MIYLLLVEGTWLWFIDNSIGLGIWTIAFLSGLAVRPICWFSMDFLVGFSSVARFVTIITPEPWPFSRPSLKTGCFIGRTFNNTKSRNFNNSAIRFLSQHYMSADFFLSNFSKDSTDFRKRNSSNNLFSYLIKLYIESNKKLINPMSLHSLFVMISIINGLPFIVFKHIQILPKMLQWTEVLGDRFFSLSNLTKFKGQFIHLGLITQIRVRLIHITPQFFGCGVAHIIGVSLLIHGGHEPCHHHWIFCIPGCV